MTNHMPKLTDLVGIAAHPEGTERVPCDCCGLCTCGANGYHYGETHHAQRWCFHCLRRGHHEADLPPDEDRTCSCGTILLPCTGCGDWRCYTCDSEGTNDCDDTEEATDGA